LKPSYPRAVRHYLVVERHTSFGREGVIDVENLNFYKSNADVIIIDEAHHFRNPRANRGQLFMELAAGKKLYMLTATPINNKLDDLYHLINYFAQDKKDHFASIRIQNLRGHFLDAEKKMEKDNPETEITEVAEDEDFIRTDDFMECLPTRIVSFG
jgi:SNF2 family DNA or RNA helicase